MPKEVGTEATRSGAPSADDSLFGDAEGDNADEAVEVQDSNGEAAPDGQDSDQGEERAAGEGSVQAEDLKVVMSIKGERATIGVQRPSADPHIETFDSQDLSGLAQEVPGVTERAMARWEDAPKHPAYERPAPSTRRRNRREQGTAQPEAAEGEAEAEQTQQQTLRLF